MINFEYLEPSNLKEAAGYLEKYSGEAKLKASGISLLLLLKQGFFTPKYIISLLKINDLAYLKTDNLKNLHIGALTTHREIEMSELVNKDFYVFAEMEYELGSVQIRNRGTIGGCICHGDPLIDPPAVLVALGGKAKAYSLNGERLIPFSEFFIGYYETALESNEILTELIIPKIPSNAGCAYIKHTLRRAMDKPFVGVAAYIEIDKNSGICSNARIVLGAISPIPVRAADVENMIIGKKLDPKTLDDIFKNYELKSMEFSYDIRCPSEYKKWTTPVIIKRAVKSALEKANRE
ncbi:MAG: xanthine dehydrogenase family protein subunit M [Actinobacteria bacterium]|nr:xanthine dehydrogenase family protein subunit M [Actinomycetota bacterium]MCL5070772.1 xanthine dehydrogenase family protein subunit M [Actinomycetota bacterium]